MHGWKIDFLLGMAYFEGGTIKLPGSTTLEPEGIPLLCLFGGYSGMVQGWWMMGILSSSKNALIVYHDRVEN